MDSQIVSSQIADIKNIPTREQLEADLHKNTLIITFKKLDGDERVMTCTKCVDTIPKEFLPKTEGKPHEKTITVWDINAQGWRSFRYDRITKVDKFIG